MDSLQLSQTNLELLDRLAGWSQTGVVVSSGHLGRFNGVRISFRDLKSQLKGLRILVEADC